jgi:DNA-binding NarL/FixJ family response regulator
MKVTLSARQQEVLRLLDCGYIQADIALMLRIDPKCVYKLVRQSADKFGIRGLRGKGRREFKRVARAYVDFVRGHSPASEGALGLSGGCE